MFDHRQYANDVMSGALVSGELARLAIERHEQWYDRPEYYFDQDAANRVLTIFSLLKHTSGEYGGKPFAMLPWQSWAVAQIFGWKHQATGHRVIKKSYIEVSKKNGKTELAAGIGIIGAFFDDEFGAEVYTAANKMDQAKICWGSAATMARFLRNESKSFANTVDLHNSFNNSKIFSQKTNSKFVPVASDSTTLDGLRPHFAIIDEFHEASDDAVLRNLESGMVNRQQPLLFIITTAGFNINGPCAKYRKVVEDIVRGRSTDDSTFGLIFSLDEGDDWHDRRLWVKANPSIGVTPTVEALDIAYTRALNEGASSEINFLTKNLNQWVRTSKTWVQDKTFMSGQAPLQEASFHGRKCFAAMDLSANVDLTCYGLLFPPEYEGQPFTFFLRVFIPEENAVIRSKRDRVPYLDWHRASLVRLTPGNVTDHEAIAASISNDADVFDLISLQYDPWQATAMAISLTERGMTCYEFRQTVTKFNEPITTIEKLLAQGLLNHGANEVLRWMAGNVVVKYASGLCKFDKDKSREKIDGLVVMAMCFGGYLQWLADNEDSIYNHDEKRNEGFLTM